MSLDAHLIHTCTIENPANGSVNVYNNETKSYATPLTGVKCRLIENTETVESDEVTEGVVRTVYRLMVRASVDLQEKAKISSVTFEDASVLSDLFEVQEVLIRRGRAAHHKTAVLERIS